MYEAAFLGIRRGVVGVTGCEPFASCCVSLVILEDAGTGEDAIATDLDLVFACWLWW